MKETPKTEAMLKGMKNKSTRQLKAISGAVCRQLENDLAAMTEFYTNTRCQYDQRLEANDAAMKTCAALADENARLKKYEVSAKELACYLDEYNKQAGENHEPLYWIACRALARYKEIGGVAEPANVRLSDDAP